MADHLGQDCSSEVVGSSSLTKARTRNNADTCSGGELKNLWMDVEWLCYVDKIEIGGKPFFDVKK